MDVQVCFGNFGFPIVSYKKKENIGPKKENWIL